MPATTRDSHTPGAVGYTELLKKYQPADRDVLRMRHDTIHGRLWVLTVASVHVYDTTSRALLRRIRLPDWSVAEFEYALPPDIAIDERGAAIISNNVEPRLFEIEPSGFATKEHRLALVSPRQSETGFSSLQLVGAGTFLAVSSTGASVFRIDLRNGIAQELSSDVQSPF